MENNKRNFLSQFYKIMITILVGNYIFSIDFVIVNLTLNINNHIIVPMSWSYGFPYSQNSQYLTALNDFSNPLYFHELNHNSLFSGLPTPFFNLNGDCRLFSPPFNQQQLSTTDSIHSFQKYCNANLNP